MPDTAKTAMVALVGRPNVGKSTLINALVGEKISIVSPKPQTTRRRICGVAERGETQFVLLDTPGLHRPRDRLGDYMVKAVRQSVADVDAVCLLAEPVAHAGIPEKKLIARIREQRLPAVLVINKIDTVEKPLLLEVMAAYAGEYDFDAIIPISARRRDGLEELMEQLEKYARPGPPLFPDGEITDQPERQLVSEIVREKLLRNLDKEVPHGVAVEVTRFERRSDALVELDVTIYCEKPGHKGIIIGRNGEMLKRVATRAREDIEDLLGTRVYLQTWVKVRENWRDSAGCVRDFGYDDR